uniref:ATP-dependent helicase C-terminal domain-containing protein n=1 Tax=Ciona savignyi TaxID=51511 RepID=H2YDL2_CIOSA
MNNLVNCGVRNIILTSGTLSPLESFTSELQIDFPVTLENDHVIDKHQVFVVTLSKGKMGGSLSSTFKTRQDTNHIEEIGHTVVDLIAASPGGALVFFPSYSAMATYMAVWKDNSNVMSLMESAKPCSIEPRNKHELKTSIEKYYSDVNSGGGAFLAVCRGKSQVLWGREWYRQQACRAVNQAIGRVIRHRYDYGAIILCDSRYAGKDQLAELPKWVQPHVIKFDDSLK